MYNILIDTLNICFCWGMNDLATLQWLQVTYSMSLFESSVCCCVYVCIYFWQDIAFRAGWQVQLLAQRLNRVTRRNQQELLLIEVPLSCFRTAEEWETSLVESNPNLRLLIRQKSEYWIDSKISSQFCHRHTALNSLLLLLRPPFNTSITLPFRLRFRRSWSALPMGLISSRTSPLSVRSRSSRVEIGSWTRIICLGRSWQ